MGIGEIKKVVNQYSILISKHYDIEKIILFGSYATGNANPESDIDIAVVMDYPESDWLKISSSLHRLKTSVDMRIEPILFSTQQDPSGFLEEINRYGISVSKTA
jgi:predicted nucleotidyltransferase